FVYDRQVDALRFAYDLSDMTAVGFGLHRMPAAFDENRQRIAFGYLRHNEWEIVVADLINESVIATLDSDNANITQYSAPIVPVIQSIENDLVAFTMVFHGTGQLQYPAYVWNLSSGALTESAVYATTSG